MPKYHISKKGDPAVCHADIRCPLGDDDNPSPHADFDTMVDAIPWAEKELAKQYETFAAAEPVALTPREIRTQIAAAEKSKSVWQGGDSKLAAERTRANVAEQDAKIEKLRAMLPEGEPTTALELHRKVLFNEGGQASVEEMVEWIESRGAGGYMSDREHEQRREVHGRIAEAHGFAAGPREGDSWQRVTPLGHGWLLEETDPKRTWGGTMTLRDANGKEVARREGTSEYSTGQKALQLIGDHLRRNPEAVPRRQPTA